MACPAGLPESDVFLDSGGGAGKAAPILSTAMTGDGSNTWPDI
jgi:hypothetical protein